MTMADDTLKVPGELGDKPGHCPCQVTQVQWGDTGLWCEWCDRGPCLLSVHVHLAACRDFCLVVPV